MEMKRSTVMVWLLLWLGLVAGLGLVGAGAPGAKPAAAGTLPGNAPLDENSCTGANLLANPSFEGPNDYSAYIPPGGHPDCPSGVCSSVLMAPAWLPWWKSGTNADFDHNPEYKAARTSDVGAFGPGDRVHSGEAAQQYFSFFSTHRAGFYQQVPAIPGHTYRFCLWGYSWSAGEYVDWDSGDPSIPDTDFASGPQFGVMMQRIGIDPNGGNEWPVNDSIDDDPSAIVWSPAREQYDVWDLFVVEAVAQANTITVYSYSDPMWPVRNNDVYWDDAFLVDITARMSLVPDDELNFLADVDAPGLMSQPIQVTLTPTATLTWTATLEAGGTLVPALSPTSGNSGDSVTVTVDSTGLPLGIYTATVTITASDPVAQGSPRSLPVTLRVVPELYYLNAAWIHQKQ